MKGLPAKAVVVLLLASSLTGCTQVLDDLQDNVARGGPGSNYEAYLSGERKLVVELDHSPGAKWDTSRPAPQDFRRQLERITAKDVEIRAQQDLPSRGQDYAWSTSELRELHEEHQDLTSDGSKVVMHALFLEGRHDERTVGLAFHAEAFALFMGKIDEVSCSNGALVCDRAERYEVVRAVSIHEAGHLFGLVNAPLPMETPREDPDHPAHSQNSDSVMFWKVESGKAITDLFSRDTVPYTFDRNDVQDARAVRGGAS